MWVQVGLTREEAVALILGQITTLRDTLAEVMDEAHLSVVDRNMLSSRQFFNRSIFYGAPEAFQAALR